MNLPGSQPIPEDQENISQARKRRIRRLPKAATSGEQQALLASLQRKTSPSFDFFLHAFLGALLTGLALTFDVTSLVLLAAVILPLAAPLFGLALTPYHFNLKEGGKTLLALLISSAMTLGAGFLSGWLNQAARIQLVSDNSLITHFSRLNWIDLLLTGISTAACIIILVRQDRLSKLSGVLLSYEITFPLAAAGFALASEHATWLKLLQISGIHIFLSLVLSQIILFLFRFKPQKSRGWIIFFIPVMALCAVLLLWSTEHQNMNQPQPPIMTPTLTQTSTPSQEKQTPTATATHTSTPTASPTPMPSATNTRTATITPTPKPTTFFGIVRVQDGALIREAPSFDAAVISYAYDGDIFEILDEAIQEDGNLWYQVQTSDGQTGWLFGDLIITPTPAQSS